MPLIVMDNVTNHREKMNFLIDNLTDINWKFCRTLAFMTRRHFNLTMNTDIPKIFFIIDRHIVIWKYY